MNRTRNAISIVIFAALTLMGLGWAGYTASASYKIPICHVPPGNPDNAHTIYPNDNGYNGHFNHHDDYFGPCKEDTTSTTSTSSTSSTSSPSSSTSSSSTSTTTGAPTIPPSSTTTTTSIPGESTTTSSPNITAPTTSRPPVSGGSTTSVPGRTQVSISTTEVTLTTAPLAPRKIGITG